jgi:hypothetical protein
VTMLPDNVDHRAHVEAWLEGARNLSPAELVLLFERALGGLWRRASLTLGEITLTAIVDRVLYTASEKYPFLATLKVDGTEIRFDEFRERGRLVPARELLDAVRFVVVEFLTVLGNLTAEILTPALRAQLPAVAVKQLRRKAERSSGKSGAPAAGRRKGTKS